MPRKSFPYYPIFLDLENRDVLIVGGGVVCARKAETLLRYGARITVVSPEVSEEIQQWSAAGTITWRQKPYEESDLEAAAIVVASTDDPCVNGRVARDCRRRKIPVNVVDVTHLCEFIVPAIVEQGTIQIAVSTGGKSPALARTVRETLQKTIGSEFAEANELLGRLRTAAKAALATDADRKRFFDGILESGLLALLRDGRREEAHELIRGACERAGIPRDAAFSEST